MRVGIATDHGGFGLKENWSPSSAPRDMRWSTLERMT